MATPRSPEVNWLRIVVAVLISTFSSAVPLSINSLWFKGVKGLLYMLGASVGLLLSFALIVLIFLPIHLVSRKRSAAPWWLYAGIGTVYILLLYVAVFLNTGGPWHWEEFPIALTCGFTVGWVFWFMLNIEKKVLVWGLGLLTPLVSYPVLALWVILFLLPLFVWYGTEIEHEKNLPDGAALQVLQIPNGSPADTAYSYELKFRASDDDDFHTSYKWDRPPWRSDIEVARLGDRVVVIPPGREALVFQNQFGQWQPMVLHKIITDTATAHPGMLVPINQQPYVTLGKITPGSLTIQAKVQFGGVLPQTATLAIDQSENVFEVLGVEFPEDPRLSYFEALQAKADRINIQTIVRDMNNDRVPEILISHADSLDDDQASNWQLYQQKNGAYERVSGTLSTTKGAVSHWTPLEKASGLTAYRPISASEGVLTTYSLEDNRIKAPSSNVSVKDRRVVNVTNTYTQLPIMSVSGNELTTILCSDRKNCEK
ncbi:MAG: hypothetical protein AB8B87_20195 [Granulosicoccus sp.]